MRPTAGQARYAEELGPGRPARQVPLPSPPPFSTNGSTTAAGIATLTLGLSPLEDPGCGQPVALMAAGAAERELPVGGEQPRERLGVERRLADRWVRVIQHPRASLAVMPPAVCAVRGRFDP